jgi:hypothetical protein
MELPMTKRRRLLRHVFLLSVFGIIFGVARSQPPDDRKDAKGTPAAELQSQDSIFLLIEQDLPEDVQSLRRGNYRIELAKLAKSYGKIQRGQVHFP